MQKSRVSGFTLIEMVAVIIILAILAAAALPRFVDLSHEARRSAVNGIAGGLRAGAALVRAKWLAVSSGVGISTLSVETQTIEVFYDTPDVGINGFPVVYGMNGGTYSLDNQNGIHRVLPLDTGWSSSISLNTTTGENNGFGWVVWPNTTTSSMTCNAHYVSGTVYAIDTGC